MARAAVLVLLLAGSGRAQDAAIEKAIERGVAWLKTKADKKGGFGACQAYGSYNDPSDRNWYDCYEAGPTAFVLFTLVKCGVPRDDPVVKRALKWLRTRAGKPKNLTAYESSAIVLAVTAVHDPLGVRRFPPGLVSRPPKGSLFKSREWGLLKKHVQVLLKGQRKNGGFGYWQDRPTAYADVSATQFALLALREAARAGYPVPVECWRDALRYMADMQLKSGSFPYTEGEGWTAGMTAAGLASLAICKEQLAAAGEPVPKWFGARVERALKSLGDAFAPDRNASKSGNARHYHYCYLYCVERVGALTGKRELGGKDWYADGAAWLLRQQRPAGQWADDTCMVPTDVLGTCFALLFLKRATPPAYTLKRD